MPTNKYAENFLNLPHRSSYFHTFDRQISLRLKCKICEEVLIEPTQNECGCRFCLPCIDNYVKMSHTICPSCQTEINKETFIPDKAIEKEIFKMQIKCLNDRCNHVCVFRDLQDHLNQCEYQQEQCDKCHETYLHNTRDQHLTDLCRQVIVKCNECGLEMTREDLEMKHKNIMIGSKELCQQLKGLCPFECCEDVQDNIKLHLVTCPHRPINCPLGDLGCEAIIRDIELSTHLQTNAPNHQMMMMNEIIRLRCENDSFKRDNESMKQEMKVIKDNNAQLIENLDSCRIIQNKIISNIENIKAEVDEYKREFGLLPENTGSEIFVIDSEATWIIRNIRQKMRDAKSGIQAQIVSDPFYIHRPGYKMCMKIYPNGDGRGLNEYLSVYFVIMKGDYDEEISWPFKQNVTLSMVNNRTNTAGITVHMNRNNNEGCYGKPTNDSNVRAEQTQFVKLTELLNHDSYVSDGAITLKLRIDSNSLSSWYPINFRGTD